jgi:hypothetical protein
MQMTTYGQLSNGDMIDGTGRGFPCEVLSIVSEGRNRLIVRYEVLCNGSHRAAYVGGDEYVIRYDLAAALNGSIERMGA